MDKIRNIENYTNYLVMPLKIAGCWDWFPHPKAEYQIITNNVYLAMVLFVITSLLTTLCVNLYTEWITVMESLEKIADGLPLIISVAIVAYFAMNKTKMYELIDFMNKNFKFHSAVGVTNLTMEDAYKTAKNFAYIYTACTLFSVSMYVILPVVIHMWTNQPLQLWVYMDVGQGPFFVIAFLRQVLGQGFIGLAVGQLGVFFASNAILVCGQLDLLCCSLRNVRYTAMLLQGVYHSALVGPHGNIVRDEKHNYLYSKAYVMASKYHYDDKLDKRYAQKRTQFDIYSTEFDDATLSALQDCARVCQVVNTYKRMFESFVSPLLVLRVVQVTMYLCTLLYAATLKFDMITVEYLGAVSLDIFVYCYFGNQIILQANRVSTAAYQCAWPTMGLRPRRLLLNMLLATRKPVVVRAGRFLPMDLHTFVLIIKTSFSYYTLLVNVNEKKK